MFWIIDTPTAGLIVAGLCVSAGIVGVLALALAILDALGGDWRPEKPMRARFAKRNRNRRRGTRFPPQFWRGMGVM